MVFSAKGTNGGIQPIAISAVCIVWGFQGPYWSTRSSTTVTGIFAEQIYSFYLHMGLFAFDLSTSVFAVFLDATQIFKMLIIHIMKPYYRWWAESLMHYSYHSKQVIIGIGTRKPREYRKKKKKASRPSTG